MANDTVTDQYVPGVCNIGLAEIQRRRNSGIAGAVGAAVVLAATLVTGAPKPFRVLTILPASVAASGFLQARMHFCAGFGMRGVFNFGATGTTDTIEQAEFRNEDQRTARTLLGGAAAIGLAVGGATLLLP